MRARRLQGLAALTALAVAWLWAGLALAQATVRTQISGDKVEVGQELTVRIQGESPDGTLDNPRLRVPPSFVVNGPSVGTQQKVSIVNGRMHSSTGTTATWVLTPTKTGKFEIGPGSFNDRGSRVSGDVVRIEVVPEGTLPQRRRRPGQLPMDDDPFSGFRRPGSLFDELFGVPGVPRTPPAPPEYQVDDAPDATAFLRATLTPATAVVGQQMTLRVYAYGARGPFEERIAKEARHPDFFAHPITGNSLKERLFSVESDGREYMAMKVREIALFPLHAGELPIGPMMMTFYGRGYLSQTVPEGLERNSNALVASVREPPAAGRPPGYQLGDVGDFTLRAEVSPTQVEAGGAVSVVAELRGTGRLPGRLVTPEGKGMDWLEPSLRDQVQVNAAGELGGSRTFTYLVRLDQPGSVSLGELTLPYYSPSQQRYRLARAHLGSVTVRASAEATPATEAAEAKLSEQFDARGELRGGRQKTRWLTDAAWFYPSLLLPPLGVLLLRLSTSAIARARRRQSARKEDPSELARQAHAEAARHIGQGDLSAGIPPLERALFLRLEACTGIKGRALLLQELASKAEQAGVPRETAELLVGILGDCQQARFGSEREDGRDLLARATRCQKALAKVRPPSAADSRA